MSGAPAVPETAANGGKREATKAANRAAILAAGREVFAEMGYGAASVRDIIRRTGLASGTFYNYFPDKESVLRELVEEIAVQARARVQAARREATTPEEFVSGAFGAYFAFLAEDPLTLELLRRNGGTMRAMFDDPSVGAGTEELREDLDAAVARGVLPPHDTGLMAAAIIGAGLEVGFRLLDEPRPDVQSAVELLRDVYSAGFARLGEP